VKAQQEPMEPMVLTVKMVTMVRTVPLVLMPILPAFCATVTIKLLLQSQGSMPIQRIRWDTYPGIQTEPTDRIMIVPGVIPARVSSLVL
jgi:hypothetical protein